MRNVSLPRFSAKIYRNLPVLEAAPLFGGAVEKDPYSFTREDGVTTLDANDSRESIRANRVANRPCH